MDYYLKYKKKKILNYRKKNSNIQEFSSDEIDKVILKMRNTMGLKFN